MSEQVNNRAPIQATNRLPNGWTWATLPELVGLDGFVVDGDWVESKDQDPDGPVRLTQLADVGDGFFRDRSDRWMNTSTADRLNCTFLKEGDVMVARMPDPLGRSCIFPRRPEKCVTVVDVCIVRAPAMDKRWLMHSINSPQTRIAIAAYQSGSTRKRISRKNLSKVRLPTPPLPEQKRIVAEIETQFTRLDAAEATLKRVQANLKRARASVLKAAVEGRLVPTEAALAREEGRDYEPASVLLERILVERKRKHDEAQVGAKRKKKYKPPVEPDTEGLAVLPEGWVWAGIDQLCAEVTDGDHQPPPVTASGIPFLVIGNVRTGRLEFDGCRRVPNDYYEGLPWKRRPDSNDLLYTVVGSFGIPVRIPDDRPFCVQRHIAILKSPLPGVRDYLQHAMASPRFFRAAAKKATGTAQKTVGLRPLRSLQVALPPLAEQTRIVIEVERQLSVLDAISQTVERNLLRCTRLRQSILKRAFEGKLVAQDPNDEPASELLARIQAASAK